MARIRTPARHVPSLLLVTVIGGGACSPGSRGPEIAPLVQAEAAASDPSAAAGRETQRIDCSGNPRALWEAEVVVQHRDGDELHQYWLLADQPDLWEAEAAVHEPLARYRDQVRAMLPDTSPLGLIRSNRDLNPWLEREYPGEGRINRLVEAGVGTHRPLNCLETQLLAYQAARFPLYEQPSEIVALIVKRSEASGDLGDLVKVYIAADGDAIVPKPKWAVESIEVDVAKGWRFHSVFHNHTFDHSAERSLLPVAAPSASDLQVSVALNERLGLEYVLVTDGFSTLELTSEEFRKLARAARSTGESDHADEPHGRRPTLRMLDPTGGVSIVAEKQEGATHLRSVLREHVFEVKDGLHWTTRSIPKKTLALRRRARRRVVSPLMPKVSLLERAPARIRDPNHPPRRSRARDSRRLIDVVFDFFLSGSSSGMTF